MAYPLTLFLQILTLQSGRSLIGSYLEAKDGKKVADGVSYLNSLDTILKAKCPSDQVAVNLDTLDRAWACIAANCVKKAGDDFTRYVKEGKNKEEAHELCSQERFIASKVRIGPIIRTSSDRLKCVCSPRRSTLRATFSATSVRQ